MENWRDTWDWLAFRSFLQLSTAEDWMTIWSIACDEGEWEIASLAAGFTAGKLYRREGHSTELSREWAQEAMKCMHKQ